MGIESSLNFRRVSDTVTTSGTVAADDLRAMPALGYQVVVDLVPSSSEYALPDEAGIVTGAGLEYIHIPVDFADPTEADLAAFSAALDANDGRMVHVHCAANYRVSVFYALYARSRGRWDDAQVEEHIRGVWNPAEFPVWEAFLATGGVRGAGDEPSR